MGRILFAAFNEDLYELHMSTLADGMHGIICFV